MYPRPVEKVIIETIITDSNSVPNQIQISSSRLYDSFWAVNPYANTEQSWYNISLEIGNSTFIIFVDGNSRSISLPDGWYATDDSFNKIIKIIKDGFESLGETINISLIPETNKLEFTSLTNTIKKIQFSIPRNQFQESSNYILGCNGLNDISFSEYFLTPDSVDLFSNGRFFIMKIQLADFGPSFQGEPQTLIILTNKSVFGSYIETSDRNFEKNLFITKNLSNLTLNIVDGKGFKLAFNKPVFIRFQIECYLRLDKN